MSFNRDAQTWNLTEFNRFKRRCQIDQSRKVKKFSRDLFLMLTEEKSSFNLRWRCSSSQRERHLRNDLSSWRTISQDTILTFDNQTINLMIVLLIVTRDKFDNERNFLLHWDSIWPEIRIAQCFQFDKDENLTERTSWTIVLLMSIFNQKIKLHLPAFCLKRTFFDLSTFVFSKLIGSFPFFSFLKEEFTSDLLCEFN